MEHGVEIWGWEEQKDLEKIMLDYVKWIFGIDFCIPRYIITRELDLDKLKIKWGIRARRYEIKVKNKEENRWIRKCLLEKREDEWKDRYGKEREKYYSRNGWGYTEFGKLGGR